MMIGGAGVGRVRPGLTHFFSTVTDPNPIN